MTLPSGYKQLEYIEATGNQWVDTGFTPNQDTRIVLDFAATTLTVTDGVKSNCLVGSRENTSSRAFALNITTEGYYRFGYNKSSPTTTAAADTNRHTADMNKNVLSLDGAVIYTATYATFSGYASVYIGQIHATSNNYYKGYVQIFACQIYNNGTLVRDFVPCQNADGAIGLWDAVSLKFYGNAGTGTFVAGPEFIIGSDRFPINYRRLSFVESTGTQYIDTGFKPNQDTRVVAQVRCIVGTSANYIFGARYALSQQNYSFFASKNGQYAFIYNTKQVDFDKSANTDEPFVIDFNKNVATIGNNSVSGTYATFAAPVNLILFGVNSPDKIIYGSSRIYSCKIYDNGTLVRDFIPCETDGGEIGFWDTVELRFYGNAGSGSFIDPLAPSDGHNTNIGGVAREIEYGTVLIGGVSREFKKGTVRVGGVLRDLVLKTDIFTITTTGKLGGYCKVTADGTSLTAGKTYEVEEDTQITVVVTSDYTANTLPGRIYLNGTLLDSRNYTFPVTSNVTIEGLDNYTTAAGGGYWGRANITTE